MTRGVWMGALLALGVAAEAVAREPQAPLILREGGQPWTLFLRVEPARFDAVTVRRFLYHRSELRGTQTLAYIDTDDHGTPFAQVVPVGAEDLSDLPDGHYHLAVVAEGELRDPDAPRFRNQHLVHFRVEEGVATRLTQAQYSAQSDPVQVIPGPGGTEVRVQRGASIPGARPAPGPTSADAVVKLNTAGVPGSNTEQNER